MKNFLNSYPNYEIEQSHLEKIVVGIDEVGRGPIAGPVVAACAFLSEDFLQSEICSKINDSKKLSKKNRKEIFISLINSVKYGVGVIDEKTIDKINILEATKLAMFESYKNFCEKYQIFPQIILVDGNFVPFKKCDEISEISPIIKGDSKSLSIAAASIIAKEIRDEIMTKNHQKYPHYFWLQNAGYPTKLHIDQITKFGICDLHRVSFEPIKSMLKSS